MRSGRLGEEKTFGRREKSLAPDGVRSPDRPGRSLNEGHSVTG